MGRRPKAVPLVLTDDSANKMLETALRSWEGHMGISCEEAARSVWCSVHQDEVCPDDTAKVARLGAAPDTTVARW